MKKIFLLLLLTTYIIFASTVEDAKKLFDNKQYKESLIIFYENEDSPEAQYYLGKAYLFSLGTDKDYKKALKYTKKSANSNFSAGINLLGMIYLDGLGIDRDEITALAYFNKSAKLGNAKAMSNIARMYAQGTLVKKDSEKAIHWSKKAVEHGDYNGYCVAGNIYLHNLRKYDLALKNFLFCEEGNNDSIDPLILANIGQIYKNSNNYPKAYEYFKKGATIKDTDAMIRLYYLLKEHQDLSTFKDEYLFWLKKAINLNDMNALSRLYNHYFYDTNQYKEALQLARNAYKNGNIEMSCKLAEYYGNAIRSDYHPNPDVDHAKSFSIASGIIKNHPTDKNTLSCYSALSNLSIFGIYTPKNIHKSIDFLKKSFKNFNSKDYLLADRIANLYLKQLDDYESAEKWYQLAFDLTKDEKYLTIVDQYKRNVPKFNEEDNATNIQNVFPLIDNFNSPQQASAIQESVNYYFIATDQKTIKIYDKKNFKLIKELRGWVGTGVKGIITSMVFDENRQLLYCTPLNSATDLSQNRNINVFDITNGKIVKTLNNKKAVKPTFLSISDDGRYILAINRAEDFNIIDTNTNDTQSYTRFLPTNHLIKGKIIKKDNDYIVYILDSQNNLWGYSINEKRQITKEIFTNQITFNTFNKATKKAKEAAKKLFIDHNNSFSKLDFKNKKLYLSEANNDNIRLFDIDKLELSGSKERNNFFNEQSISTLEIKYKNDYTTLEVYKKSNKKLLTTIDLLWTKPLRHQIIDDKYILVVTDDFSQMLIFDLNGKAIANLSGIRSLQNNILYYKDGYLFSSGLDKIIHIWDLNKLNTIDTKVDIYDESILRGLSNMAKGNPLDMLTETLDTELLEQQAKLHGMKYVPTEKQFKFFMKTLFLKKEIIYPLASLYIKNNDWIIYNKQGLFASSSNGQNLIKYHLNQGLKKEAKIIENDQIFERFYRPDLIKKILEKEDVNSTIDVRVIIQNIHPPQISIVDTKMQDEKNLRLRYQICDAGHGVSNTNIILNNIAVNPQKSRGFSIEKRKKDNNKCEIYQNIITLTPGINTLAIKSFDKKKIISNTSEPLTIEANYTIEKKPNLHFISLAVSDYGNDSFDLKYPVKDVLAVEKKIQKKGKALFKHIYTYNLHDHNMTKENLNKVFDNISKNIDINDVFVMYIAGHGVTEDGIYYFLPYNIKNSSPDSLKKDAISVNDLTQQLAKISANKSLILLDTCGSGGVIDNVLNTEMAVGKLLEASGRNYIAASSDKQVALEGYKDHGVFTYVVLNAFKKASIIEQDLTVMFLKSILKKDVPKITKENFHYEQTPTFSITEDFAIGTN